MVVYDAHSIRSHIPHLFDGELPQFNLGTAGPSGAPDTSCDNALSDVVENLLKISGMSQVRNGRFKGGWITRHYSNIAGGVHSLQMELACRGYMHEPLPDQVDEHSWPTRSTRPRRTAAPHPGAGAQRLPRIRYEPERRMTRNDPSRTLAAPTGTTLNAKSWLTEARYGGMRCGRAPAGELRCLVEMPLKRLDDDQTLLVQSGKPVGVFRTHADAARADRQFQPGTALGQLGPLQRAG